MVEKLSGIPIDIWYYNWDENKAKHIGPYAQDFKMAFDCGDSDIRTNTINPDDVALGCIQCLHMMYKESEERHERSKLESERHIEQLQMMYKKLEEKFERTQMVII